jgi:sulfur carrier protein
MNIQVNGEKREIRAAEILAGLVKQMHPHKQRIAVLLNDELIPADQMAGRILKEGDRVEILTFAGGG